MTVDGIISNIINLAGSDWRMLQGLHLLLTQWCYWWIPEWDLENFEQQYTFRIMWVIKSGSGANKAIQVRVQQV